MSRGYKPILILCEDRQQEVAVRHFLKQYYGLDEHAFQVKFAASGSGKQFVQLNYANWVKLYRQKANHLNIALVVVLDADENTLLECQQVLDEQLETHNLTPRADQERIVLFIPKRNIETWLHFLNGNAVDDATDYSRQIKRKNPSECKPAIEKLAGECKKGIPLDPTAPPSLSVACTELQRLPRFTS
jgi:hypothetical protein